MWRRGVQEEGGLLAGVVKVLAAPVPALAAKGVVAVGLLARTSPGFLLAACRARLPQLVRLLPFVTCRIRRLACGSL